MFSTWKAISKIIITDYFEKEALYLTTEMQVLLNSVTLTAVKVQCTQL